MVACTALRLAFPVFFLGQGAEGVEGQNNVFECVYYLLRILFDKYWQDWYYRKSSRKYNIVLGKINTWETNFFPSRLAFLRRTISTFDIYSISFNLVYLARWMKIRGNDEICEIEFLFPLAKSKPFFPYVSPKGFIVKLPTSIIRGCWKRVCWCTTVFWDTSAIPPSIFFLSCNGNFIYPLAWDPASAGSASAEKLDSCQS